MADRDNLTAATIAGTAWPAGKGGTVSIVVMDSGMGGLSICADLVNGLQRLRPVERAAITYFNAWPEQDRGYNSLPDTAERLRVFDQALEGMRAFSPDIVYMACNTLSILYPHTRFSRQAQIPVVGIVEFGVDLIYRHLLQHPDSQVIILGTLTTISSGSHQKALTARGIDGRRIVNQACHLLATEIEKDPQSRTVRAMIDAFIREAAAGLANPGAPVVAALCCTHFGYARGIFERSLEACVSGPGTVLNPNDAMSSHLFSALGGPPGDDTQVALQVVSRIVWSDRKVKAIARALNAVSPFTARALENYRYDPELFSI